MRTLVGINKLDEFTGVPREGTPCISWILYRLIWTLECVRDTEIKTGYPIILQRDIKQSQTSACWVQTPYKVKTFKNQLTTQNTWVRAMSRRALILPMHWHNTKDQNPWEPIPIVKQGNKLQTDWYWKYINSTYKASAFIFQIIQ